jgi:Uncharacterized membrane protein (homolog of Drosophila rhomboid)
MFNVTPLVRTLIIINIAVFLLQNLAAGFHLTEYLSLWDMHSGYFRPYQFFTYMFAHGGFGHIFFNMLAFASFAPILESYWGDKKFLTFYLATGIGAGLIYAIVNYFFFPGMAGSMLGASGALYGILMAFGMVFPNLEITLLFPPIPDQGKVHGVSHGLFNLCPRSQRNGSPPGALWWSHCCFLYHQLLAQSGERISSIGSITGTYNFI